MLMVEISAALVDQPSSADDFQAGFGGRATFGPKKSY
jgi:hypothetical protein